MHSWLNVFRKFQLKFSCDLGACDNRDQMVQSSNDKWKLCPPKFDSFYLQGTYLVRHLNKLLLHLICITFQVNFLCHSKSPRYCCHPILCCYLVLKTIAWQCCHSRGCGDHHLSSNLQQIKIDRIEVLFVVATIWFESKIKMYSTFRNKPLLHL